MSAVALWCSMVSWLRVCPLSMTLLSGFSDICVTLINFKLTICLYVVWCHRGFALYIGMSESLFFTTAKCSAIVLILSYYITMVLFTPNSNTNSLMAISRYIASVNRLCCPVLMNHLQNLIFINTVCICTGWPQKVKLAFIAHIFKCLINLHNFC